MKQQNLIIRQTNHGTSLDIEMFERFGMSQAKQDLHQRVNVGNAHTERR